MKTEVDLPKFASNYKWWIHFWRNTNPNPNPNPNSRYTDNPPDTKGRGGGLQRVL